MEDVCAICMVSPGNNKLPCGHIYHDVCLTKLIENGENITLSCLICRAEHTVLGYIKEWVFSIENTVSLPQPPTKRRKRE